MKQRKIELALLVVTVGFVCFCVGLFLGRRHEPDTVTITTDLAVAQPSAESVSPSVQVQEESDQHRDRGGADDASRHRGEAGRAEHRRP